MADRPPRTDNIPAPETELRTTSELFDDKAPKYAAQRTPGDRAFEKEWGFNVKPQEGQSVGDQKFDPKRMEDGSNSRSFPGGTRIDWDAVGDVFRDNPGPMATAKAAGMAGTRPVQPQPQQRAMSPEELSKAADLMMAQIRAQQASVQQGSSYVGQLAGLTRQVPPSFKGSSGSALTDAERKRLEASAIKERK